jgi:glycosyltransferase involved in cell wall biosynthesis
MTPPADDDAPPPVARSVDDWLETTRSALAQGQTAAARRAVLRGLSLSDRLWVEAGKIAALEGDRDLLRRVVGAIGPLEHRHVMWSRRVLRWADATGDDELLETGLDSLLAKEPDDLEGLRARGALICRRSGLDAARAALDSPEPPYRTALGLQELEYGDPERGLAILSEPWLAPTPGLLRLEALALHRRGLWTLALARYAAAVLAGDDGRAAERAAKIEAERSVFGGSWSPPAVTAPRHTPRARRVLHLVGKSLPTVSSGFTVRTNNVMLAQRAVGLMPAAVTQLGFPTGNTKRRHFVDELEYFRVRSDEPAPARLDRRLEQNLAGLAHRVERWRPAALHPHSNFLNASLALRLREHFEIPVVYEVRGFWEESWVSGQPDEAIALSSDYYLAMQAIEERCMREADRVVTLAEVMKDHIVARGIDSGRVTVVPNSVDPERFHPVPRDEALRRRLGLDHVGCVLGYVSSIRPLERIEDLLRATAILRDRGLDVGVLVVGDGNSLHRVRQCARELGLGDRAVLPGSVPHDEVLQYYAQIDVFVVPRGGDRVSGLVTPLKPFEAMATGLPVVVADVPALREIVKPGETGLTFRPDDPSSIADAVEPLVGDPSARTALGQAGREWVLAERTWAHAGRRYRDLYDGLL